MCHHEEFVTVSSVTVTDYVCSTFFLFLCSGGSGRSSVTSSHGSTRMSWTQLSSFMSSAHRNRMRISQQQVRVKKIDRRIRASGSYVVSPSVALKEVMFATAWVSDGSTIALSIR